LYYFTRLGLLKQDLSGIIALMKTAVIATGGKQYLVSEGTTITIEKLPVPAGKEDYKKGDSVVFDEVLMTDNGKDIDLGKPTVSGATVSAIVLSAGRAKKVTVIRYKAKSRYFKKKGHRQPFVKVKIDKV